jgi:hypothetical protein
VVHDDIVFHSWNGTFVVVVNDDDENAAAVRDGGASTRAVALHAAVQDDGIQQSFDVLSIEKVVLEKHGPPLASASRSDGHRRHLTAK